ncbi:hypothetical protein D3C80_1960160 [compost metagenome]
MLAAFGFQAWQKTCRLGEKRLGAGEIGRKLEPAQLHCTADANAGRKPRDNETMTAEGHLRAQIEGA